MRCNACAFAECKKINSKTVVTHAIWLFKSYPVKANRLWKAQSGAHKCSMALSPQTFNVLFPLSYSTAGEPVGMFGGESVRTPSQGPPSAERLQLLIWNSPKTLSCQYNRLVRGNHLHLTDNNGVLMLFNPQKKWDFCCWNSCIYSCTCDCVL